MFKHTLPWGRSDLPVLLKVQVGLGDLLAQGLPEKTNKYALVTIPLYLNRNTTTHCLSLTTSQAPQAPRRQQRLLTLSWKATGHIPERMPESNTPQ